LAENDFLVWLKSGKNLAQIDFLPNYKIPVWLKAALVLVGDARLELATNGLRVVISY
jgi:hypothetical protein